ncbi:hypothetical protein K435DRAFT_856223 [Dendrothele bispora CBS 962.96]|uniref:Uncharacterized protein n=1 Tax=Dendrothele bispora (strain CBS 962.96) TaxID=1314807 RepID=A0A4S8M913_DENBC|nr:hypothetical protein K435DRAFT_856223 [Dendrothele bispora CBS 962.96]
MNGQVIKSTGYDVQQMFSLNRGDEYISSTLTSEKGTLFWAVLSKQTDTIIMEV